MRENRLYGSGGGEPQLNAAFLPLSINSRRGASCIKVQQSRFPSLMPQGAKNCNHSLQIGHFKFVMQTIVACDCTFRSIIFWWWNDARKGFLVAGLSSDGSIFPSTKL